MVILMVGILLLLLGLFSGGVLVVAPLGLAPWSADPVLWVLFPLFCIAGSVLWTIGARGTEWRRATLLVSASLLVLALASAAGLVLGAAAILKPVGSTMPLWYVLAVAGVLGSIGAASSERRGDTP